MVTKEDITIVKRDDLDFKITLSSNGSALNITNYTFYLTVKPDTSDDSASDATAVIDYKKSVHNGDNDDPTNGITVLEVARADTVVPKGTYYYDIRVLNTTTDKLKTLLYGKFIVLQDITETEA